MSVTLKVTPEKLINQAGVVENQARALEVEFNSIQDKISRTTGYWIGIAGDKARNEFDSQKDEMETILKRFREHPRDLLEMAGLYERTEDTNESSNQALQTDVIA